MVEEMVPKHLMLEKVVNMLEVILQIGQSVLIVSNFGIGKVTMVKHDSFYWERKVSLDHADCILIVDKHILNHMWLVLLVINSDINQLLSVKVTQSRLICL